MSRAQHDLSDTFVGATLYPAEWSISLKRNSDGNSIGTDTDRSNEILLRSYWPIIKVIDSEIFCYVFCYEDPDLFERTRRWSSRRYAKWGFTFLFTISQRDLSRRESQSYVVRSAPHKGLQDVQQSAVMAGCHNFADSGLHRTAQCYRDAYHNKHCLCKWIISGIHLLMKLGAAWRNWTLNL